MFSLVYLMLLSHSIFVTSMESHTSCEDNASNPKSIFILAGQSNMAGRGGVFNKVWNKVVPLECQSNQRILRLNAGLTWEEAREPLHDGIDLNKTCGIGPGMSFANSVLQRDPNIGVIGLVPCARGGTTLSQWSPYKKLYNNTLSRAQTALSNGGGQIRAILWYQGESDTVTEAVANAYKYKWEKLFTQLRSDLQLPNLPVIEVVIESADGMFLENVRKAQKAIDLPNVKFVDSMGLELSGDKIHLSTNGEIKLGKMLADAFLRF